MRRDRAAQVAVALFAFMVAACLAAPLYAEHVAGTGPNKTHVTEKVERGGEQVDVVSPDGKPIGPAFGRKYLLGADSLGRDVMVRILYGGRNSLRVGIVSALITLALAALFGLLAGYFRGWVDRVISAVFDVMWSFPPLLFAIALGTAFAVRGLDFGFIALDPQSVWIPTLIIGVAYTPYLGRTVRGQVLSLREKEFVEAAVAQGMGSMRIMFSEILPNLASTLLIFSTLIVANNILLETALSYLGAGIQPPEPSWGNLVGDGSDRIVSAPHLAIAPGVAIVLTVLALNIFGDSLRDALNPRAKVLLR